MVGPLPVSDKTTIATYDYVFNGGSGGSVPFNGRYLDGKWSAGYEPLLKSVMTEVADITKALFNGTYYGSSDNRTDIVASSTGPNSLDGSTAWVTNIFRYPGQATYLVPLDFYVLLDITGTDVTKYSLRGYVTNTRFFPTAADLRAAFEAGELKNEFPQTRDNSWAMLDHKPEMGVRDLEDRLAPQSLELGGKRYKLDREQRYVEFMGWSFYMSFTRVLGLQFYDIKFKGERVLYELSLQEAAAQYAGNQPKAANTVYHDTFFSVRFSPFQLILSWRMQQCGVALVCCIQGKPRGEQLANENPGGGARRMGHRQCGAGGAHFHNHCPKLTPLPPPLPDRHLFGHSGRGFRLPLWREHVGRQLPYRQRHHRDPPGRHLRFRGRLGLPARPPPLWLPRQPQRLLPALLGQGLGPPRAHGCDCRQLRLPL
jgi:hypothetical protein